MEVGLIYYVEPPFSDPIAFLVLLVFVLFNQAWFMGALFLIAGYFTPGSFERKGSGAFLKERLLRLGIPLIFFFFVLSPISSIGYWQMPVSLTGITNPLTWQAYPYLLGMGPLWFVALLLIFDFGYAAWRRLTRNRTSSSMSETSTPAIQALASSFRRRRWLVTWSVSLSRWAKMCSAFQRLPTSRSTSVCSY
jgi:glucan biosynthesis protein C